MDLNISLDSISACMNIQHLSRIENAIFNYNCTPLHSAAVCDHDESGHLENKLRDKCNFMI